MSLATNKQILPRVKHIDLRTPHMRELVMNNVIRLLYVQSRNNIADLFTKILGLPKIFNFIQLMNIPKDRKYSSVRKANFFVFFCLL